MVERRKSPIESSPTLPTAATSIPSLARTTEVAAAVPAAVSLIFWINSSSLPGGITVNGHPSASAMWTPNATTRGDMTSSFGVPCTLVAAGNRGLVGDGDSDDTVVSTVDGNLGTRGRGKRSGDHRRHHVRNILGGDGGGKKIATLVLVDRHVVLRRALFEEPVCPQGRVEHSVRVHDVHADPVRSPFEGSDPGELG